jgi:hypothetical protein
MDPYVSYNGLAIAEIGNVGKSATIRAVNPMHADLLSELSASITGIEVGLWGYVKNPPRWNDDPDPRRDEAVYRVPYVLTCLLDNGTTHLCSQHGSLDEDSVPELWFLSAFL